MSLLTLLLKRVYWYAETLQLALESNGVERLTRAQTFVIANIVSGESQASKIAKNLGVSRQAISLILIELSKRGYITTRDDPANRRSRIVDIAPDFEKKGELCLKLIAQLDEELGRRIGKKSLQSLRESLEAEWGAIPELQLPSKARAAATRSPKRLRTARAIPSPVERRRSA